MLFAAIVCRGSCATKRKDGRMPMISSRRFRCRFCGLVLNAWLPVAREPDGAMVLNHLSHQHLDHVKDYLDRMHTDEDISPVAAEAFAVVEEPA
jgi:hypothetical protein